LIKSLYDFFQWFQWLKSLLLVDFKILKCNAVWNGGKHESSTLTYKVPVPHPIGGCVAGGVRETIFGCLLRAEYKRRERILPEIIPAPYVFWG
jgi:hypothetical protein